MFVAKGFDEFDWGAHLFEGVQGEDIDVFHILYTGVSIFFDQGIEYFSGLLAKFDEVVALSYIFSAFAPCEWRLPKGDMAN